MNEYGLDVNYFKEKLSLILRDIGCYRPEEMHRELSRLADVVAPAQAQQPPQDLGNMNHKRAAYFMRRFRGEEKLLGLNEQAAVDYVIALLEQSQAQQESQVCDTCRRAKHDPVGIYCSNPFHLPTAPMNEVNKPVSDNEQPEGYKE